MIYERASQSIIGWSGRLFRPILVILRFQEIARIVRIPLPLLRATRARLGGMQKPNVLPPKRDAKDDSILGSRRENQRRRRHATSCMETIEVSGNSQEVRYSQGKALFCSGGQGIRTKPEFPRESEELGKPCDKSDAGTSRRRMDSPCECVGLHRR